ADARRDGARAALAKRGAVERHLRRYRRHRTRPVRDVCAPGGELPLAPPGALEARPRVERQRVERALERHRDPRRARERAAPAPAPRPPPPPPAPRPPPPRAARPPGAQRGDPAPALRLQVP